MTRSSNNAAGELKPLPRPPRLGWPLFAWTALLSGWLPSTDGAVTTSEWKHLQTFDLRETGLVKIALPPATLDLARPALVDLRLLGPGGEEIPYVIDTATRPTPIRQAPTAFRVELQKLSTQLTVTTGTERPIDRIHLSTSAAGFVKAARLEISDDGTRWELVGDGFQLARQPGLDALTLPLGKVAARYLRITVDDWRTPVIPFTGATLELAPPEDTLALPLESEIVKRNEFARETVLTIHLPARHVPLAWLQFITAEPVFARVVSVAQRELSEGQSSERTIATGSIFRSQLAGRSGREHLRVPLNFTPGARELKVHLVNENNAPLALEQVEVMRRPVWLTFHATAGGTYQLLTGHATAPSPRYDVARFAEEWKTLPETTVTVSRAELNPGYRRPDTLAEVPLLGAKLDVSKWNYRKAVIPPAAGVQELELDMEVLAQADRSLRDLRLMRDGHQVPYVLERATVTRSISLPPMPAEDAAPRGFNWWKFTLPVRALPVSSLTVTSSTPLFSRRIQVFELTTDSRGETLRRNLSDVLSWSRTPDEPPAQRTLDLSGTPSTDVLYLETEDGDNPGIKPGEARADYPVIRLLFRTDAEPLYLYYGAAHVAAPRYDLELVAPQLLSEEKVAPTLRAVETLSREGGAFFLSGKSGGVLLWGSLALVVGVLLFAIARLLPKPPPSGSD